MRTTSLATAMAYAVAAALTAFFVGLTACRTGDAGSAVRDAEAGAVPTQCLAKAEAVKTLQAQVDQQSSTQNAGCAAKGGQVGADKTCRCPDGTAAFKLGNAACAQAGAAQNDGCATAGGTVGTDGACRCADGTAVFKLHGQTCAEAAAAGGTQNDGCAAAGGTVGTDGACRCADGTAVFKLHGQTCAQAAAAAGSAPPGDGSAGLALTGGAARPEAHYRTAAGAVPGTAGDPQLGLADAAQPTLAQQLVQAQQSLTDCLSSAGAVSGGGGAPAAGGGGEGPATGAACVFCEKATGAVQSACVPNTDLAGCYNAFNTYYETVAPGSYEARLMPGATCAQARAGAATGPLRGACVYIERATAKLQASCTANVDPQSCDAAFQKSYEDVAPGHFEHLLVNGKTCAEAQAGFRLSQTTDPGTTRAPGGAGTAPATVPCWCGWSTNGLCGIWKGKQLYYPYFGPVATPFSCGDSGAYDLCRQPELVALKAATCQ